jgi:hypothetical protein
MLDTSRDHEIARIKAEAEVELLRLEKQSPAKKIAGKALGKHGLFYITLIVVIGVVSSLFLEQEKFAAVIGLLGASLTAFISMLNGIAKATPKQEKPEFQLIQHLIDKLDQLDRSQRNVVT